MSRHLNRPISRLVSFGLLSMGLKASHASVLTLFVGIIAALIAEIRAMSLLDVLEVAWSMVVGLFALIGAILKGIWNGILSLLGRD